MFLLAKARKDVSESFPRARGDVPPQHVVQAYVSAFSPRTRGCSQMKRLNTEIGRVFPAHAGMFLSGMTFFPTRPRFPRARGDVPNLSAATQRLKAFSPRTRGCSQFIETYEPIVRVFPAHAGMFPRPCRQGKVMVRFPRARGDVPAVVHSKSNLLGFSPRTRGCSRHGRNLPHWGHVFPAHAGMFRTRSVICGWRFGFPRARGDVPSKILISWFFSSFSPRTRGCSAGVCFAG